MKLNLFISAVSMFLGFNAFAADPVCLTLHIPGKWGAGLVLRIVGSSDGTQTAYLQSTQMFRSATSASPSDWLTLAAISPVTRMDAGGGRVIYAGGSGTRTLNATIGSPDQNGNIDGTVSIQQDGLSINATGVTVTRFSGDAKCQ